MTEEQILDYNKMCSEFLYPNAKEEYDSDEISIEDGMFIKGMLIFGHFHMMKFHSDWNWIMKVLNKIASLDLGWKVTSKYVNIYSHSGDPRGEFDCKFEMNCPQDVIVDTVKTINQFLIWYNNNKP